MLFIYITGGCLLAKTPTFNGEGTVETIGGSGHGNGGGGGGGRTAIYYTVENAWTGEYLMHGGFGVEHNAGSGKRSYISSLVKEILNTSIFPSRVYNSKENGIIDSKTKEISYIMKTV